MNRNTLFWGFVLITIGVVFLLSNLGVISIDAWGILWPLVLVAFGVWVLLGSVLRRGGGEGEHAAVSLDGAAAAGIRIHHGAGRLYINDSAEPGNLVSGNFGGGLRLRKRRERDALFVDMRIEEHSFPFIGWPGALDWKVGLSSAVPVSLEINTGASEADLNLENLMITDLKLGTGASSTNLTLPARAGRTRASVEAGAASVSIQIPEGVAADIRVRSGLSGVNVNQGRFPYHHDSYRSADYDTAPNKVDLLIETGVGSITVY